MVRGFILKKLFVGNLPGTVTDTQVHDLFAQFGTVRSLTLATDVFTHKCKGFGFVEMEGHEARAAIAGLDGKDFNGKPLKVKFEMPKGKRSGRR